MRPDRGQSDLEFWMQAVEHWKQRRMEYRLMATKAATPEDEAWFEQLDNWCVERTYRAELAYQEARGDIEVYTGRAKPRWS